MYNSCGVRRVPNSNLLPVQFDFGNGLSCVGGYFLHDRKLLVNPDEGDLWQADHIVPVSGGGGESDLSNFQV